MKSVWCACVVLATVFTASAVETDERISLLQTKASVDVDSAGQVQSQDQEQESYSSDDKDDGMHHAPAHLFRNTTDSGSTSKPGLPAYGKALPSDERILLLVLANAFHGSTALEGILMSSPHLATLCSAGAWQCEGKKVMMNDHRSLSSFDAKLDSFGQYWDLDRPILMDKTPTMTQAVPHVHEGMKAASLSARYAQHGIKQLRLAYMIMWRPSCLWSLSSHAERSVKKDGMENYAGHELNSYLGLIKAHKFLSENGVPVVVFSFGELIWRPHSVARRAEQFLPSIGTLQASYVPELGRDVVEGNQWKARDSVVTFGEKTDPNSMGYNVQEDKCRSKYSLFSSLAKEDLERATDAEDYLRSASRE